MDSWSNRFMKYVTCSVCSSRLGDVQWDPLGHFTLLILMTASVFVLLIPDLDPTMRRLPGCVRSDGTLYDACNISAGTVAVLRISSVYLLYWVLSFFLKLVIKKFDDRASKMHCGVWVVKFATIALLCYVSCYIPPRMFDKVITILLSFGSVLFMVLQLYTIVRLSYLAMVTLHVLAEGGSRSAQRIRITLFVLGAVLSVLAEAILIYCYPLCSMNIVFLLTNALVPFVACLWSGSECVRARNGYSGFIQGCLLTCFVIYYTWSAFTNNPEKECNPYFHGHGPLNFYHFTSVIAAFAIYLINTNFTYVLYVDDEEESISSRRDEGKGDAICSRILDEGKLEYKVRVYNSFLCNFIRGPMLCYIVMAILDWSPLSASLDYYKTNRIAMWFKLVGCWLSTGFFIVTLYMPNVYGVLPKRNLLGNN